MKNTVFTTLLFLVFSFSMMGQELDQFQYVRVPEKFDFLNEENQYQLNALTAFLFDKFGFTVLYKEKAPEGVKECDILQSNVHNESGLFRTKLYVTLENCKNEVLFTSQTGVSKEKIYKKSYQEALRDAFRSVEELNHKYNPGPGEVIVDAVVSVHEKKESRDKSAKDEIIIDPVVSSEEIKEVEAEVERSQSENVVPSEMTFVNGAMVYTLKETAVGYDLFRNQGSEKFASLVKSGNGNNYLYASKNVRGLAYFDSNKNLVVEYLDSDNSQLLTIIYKRKL